MQQDGIIQASKNEKRHPDYSQIWLPSYHDLILEEACSTCNYCSSQYPEEILSEIGIAVTVHHSSPSAPSASMESPHLCGNPVAITDRLNATLVRPDSVSLLGFLFSPPFQ